jgi:hypothetical protein
VDWLVNATTPSDAHAPAAHANAAAIDAGFTCFLLLWGRASALHEAE